MDTNYNQNEKGKFLFTSKPEAEAFIMNELCPDRYYLNHNEYAAPDFSAKKYNDGWGIRRKVYYNIGSFNCPVSGRY